MALILAALAMPTTGCIVIAHVSINDQINNEKVEFIQEGRTTFKDVVEELGAPTRIVGIKSGGAVAVYQFLDIRYSSVNYGYLTKFAPQAQGQSFDLVLAGGGLGTDMFEVIFDERWIVKHYMFTKHAEKVSRYVFWPF
jgi:hypothetical protein